MRRRSANLIVTLVRDEDGDYSAENVEAVDPEPPSPCLACGGTGKPETVHGGERQISFFGILSMDWCSKCSGSGFCGWTDEEWFDDEVSNSGGVHNLIFGGEPPGFGGIDELIVSGYLDVSESHSLDSMYPEVDVTFEIEMICIPEDVTG